MTELSVGPACKWLLLLLIAPLLRIINSQHREQNSSYANRQFFVDKGQPSQDGDVDVETNNAAEMVIAADVNIGRRQIP